MIKFKNNKGFTLIEILLATAILVMVGVAVIGVERQFMGSAGVNKHKLQATALAQEGISAVRAAYNTQLFLNGTLTAGDYAVLNNSICIIGTAGCDATLKDITLNNVKFTRTITVPPLPVP